MASRSKRVLSLLGATTVLIGSIGAPQGQAREIGPDVVAEDQVSVVAKIRRTSVIETRAPRSMTVVVGRRTRVRVDIARIARAQPYPLFLAFGLFEERNGEVLPEGDYFLIGTIRECIDSACTRRLPIHFDAGPGTFNGVGELDAGTYRLIVVSWGTPLIFRLKAEALSGSVRLSPEGVPTVDFESLALGHEREDRTHTYWGGDSFDSGNMGLAGATALIDAGSSRVPTRFGFCSYAGPVAPESPDAYRPECSDVTAAGAGAGAGATLSRRTRGIFTYSYLFRYTPDAFPPNATGERGLGGWIRAESRLRLARLSAFHLSLN